MTDEKLQEIVEMEKGPIALENENPASRVQKHGHDADEAMKAFAEGEVEIIDEATNKRLLRTIDFNIMPVSGLRK